MVLLFPVTPETHINFIILNRISVLLFYIRIVRYILRYIFGKVAFVVFEKHNNFGFKSKSQIPFKNSYFMNRIL